ncbi:MULTISPECIES: hypothetical protein [unclassified Treponema]|uniref:hypothetical protein n=1 Tax=unclassified Treponema TaxID=2638727 RepID=UPI0020A46279|nr:MULTISPECIES: hypothetical protein [unclassified Treponema]UTC66081.1 hypothetical protein E4O06_08605 [Treponema sp. OMZ 789]UTC68811.1 hypothetical protein E4O01_08745 [Treponema sp. OMZ 790]UTC71539.1 hypothetical protein E4O02_08935 [Treponema sp. OMZ 791]
MTSMNLFPHKKNTSAHNTVLTDAEIHAMEVKLEDPEYMDAAIYRLASIITERILNGGLDYVNMNFKRSKRV